MSAPVRAIVAFLMAVGILMSIGDLFDVGVDYGYFDPYDIDWTIPANIADAIRVTSVVRGSPAERDDVRVGDILRLRRLTWIERSGVPPADGVWHAVDDRTGKALDIKRHPRPPLTESRRAFTYSWVTLRLLVEIAGLAILLWRGNTVVGAGLAIFLFSNQFAYLATAGEYLGRVWMALWFGELLGLIQATGYLAIVAVGFASVPPSPRRKITATVVFSLAFAIVGAFVSANLYYLATGIAEPWNVDPTWGDRFNMAMLLAAISALIVAIHRSYGIERRRLIILTASLSIGAFNEVLGVISTLAPNGLYTLEQGMVAEACTFLMGLGLLYGIFVERLFDVEFVLNRAVVFTVVSGIVVTSFAAIEWVIGTYATNLLGKAQSIALQMLIALGIGLSLRRLHGAVDKFVDRWLFEERHRRANALLTFAAEAATISSPDSLLQATIGTLRTFGGVSRCEVLLANDKGDFEQAVAHEGMTPNIERDDLVAVRLRTSRRPLDRRDFPPLTFADVAFPMTVGHELAGILLCTQPTRAEPYSPEEIDALSVLSHEVAMALVALEAREARRMRQAFALDRVT